MIDSKNLLCEYQNCKEEAFCEAWIGHGRMLYMRLCYEHAKLSRTYEAKGELAFIEAKENSYPEYCI